MHRKLNIVIEVLSLNMKSFIRHNFIEVSNFNSIEIVYEYNIQKMSRILNLCDKEILFMSIPYKTSTMVHNGPQQQYYRENNSNNSI